MMDELREWYNAYEKLEEERDALVEQVSNLTAENDTLRSLQKTAQGVMDIIKIGTLTIIERPEVKHSHKGLTAYEIFVDGEKYGRMIYAADIRLVVLYALEYQQFGLNSQFAHFASKMLGIEGEVWAGTTTVKS